MSYIEKLIKNGTEILANNKSDCKYKRTLYNAIGFEEMEQYSVHKLIERLEKESQED